MAPAEDPPELLSGKHKRTEMEQSKAGRAGSPTSTTSISSTVSKAKKKIKGVAKKVKKIASGVVKGKKTVASPSPSEVPPRTKSPSIAPSRTSDADLPALENPLDSDSDSDHSSICEVQAIEEETDEAELEHMMKKWSTLAYAFFHPTPAIKYHHHRKCHVFSCAVKGCKQSIAHYLDTTDKKSTGNMHKHIRSCWGSDVLDMVDNVENLENARKIVKAHRNNGMITSMFQCLKGKGAVTYSHCAHTKSETRAEIVCWVSESLCPFNIMKDHSFNCLMKMGRPMYYLPHPTMVSRDVKTVFAKTRQHIAKLLQEYDGELNFATDAWTSPNHQAFVAFTVHFIHVGQPVRMLLDFVEVAKSHSGESLAEAFEQVLKDFRVTDKVLSITCDNASNTDTMIKALGDSDNVPSFSGQASRTCCFAHIVNLMAKSLLKQFDPPRCKSNDNRGPDNDTEHALHDLVGSIEIEELEAHLRDIKVNGSGIEADDEEGLVDVTMKLTDEDRE